MCRDLHSPTSACMCFCACLCQWLSIPKFRCLALLFIPRCTSHIHIQMPASQPHCSICCQKTKIPSPVVTTKTQARIWFFLFSPQGGGPFTISMFEQVTNGIKANLMSPKAVFSIAHVSCAELTSAGSDVQTLHESPPLPPLPSETSDSESAASAATGNASSGVGACAGDDDPLADYSYKVSAPHHLPGQGPVSTDQPRLMYRGGMLKRANDRIHYVTAPAGLYCFDKCDSHASAFLKRSI